MRYSSPMLKKIFIVADGEIMPLRKRKELRKGRFTIAVDGAAELAKQERWVPDLIGGDFDTATNSTLHYFSKKNIPLLPLPDQNFTDLEKTLAWCVYQGADSIWVANALGKRLDHSLTNLALLKRFYRRGKELLLFTGSEKIRYVKNETITLKGKAGRAFAVIPFPKGIVTSKGLVFEMLRFPLELGLKESVSNLAKTATVKLSIKGEALVIEAF